MEMGCQEQEVKLKYSAIALEKIVMLHPVDHLQPMILTVPVSSKDSTKSI
jgi:hypothetical protein